MINETDLKTLGVTLGDVNTFAIVDTFAHTLAERRTNTVHNKLVDVRAKALINKLAVTLLDAEP